MEERDAQNSLKDGLTSRMEGEFSEEFSLLQRTTEDESELQSKHSASLSARTAKGKSVPRRSSRADQNTFALRKTRCRSGILEASAQFKKRSMGGGR